MRDLERGLGEARETWIVGASERGGRIVRVPFSEIYRAFPELDSFSDAECKRFVKLAKSKRWRVLRMQVKAGLAGLCGLSVGVVVSAYGLDLLSALLLAPRRTMTFNYAVFPMLIIAAGVLCAGLGAAFVRDRWLRKTITERVSRAACPRCGYSLLGLTPVDGCMTCPECAQRVSLIERGLSLEDVLARIKCRCGESLAGLAPQSGAIPCPKCGEPFHLARNAVTEQDVLLASRTKEPGVPTNRN